MKNYQLFPKNHKALTFAKGINQLKDAGYKRPLSFDEVIKARVDEYSSGNKKLFNYRIDTCTGTFYKGGSDLVKLVRIDPSLIDIDENFTDAFIKQAYSKFDGFEIIRSKAKYNQFLTKNEVLDHPVWNWLVPDKNLLKYYSEIIFSYKDDFQKSMGIWLRKNKEYTTSRAMFVDDIYNDSVAYCINYLFDNARFLVN